MRLRWGLGNLMKASNNQTNFISYSCVTIRVNEWRTLSLQNDCPHFLEQQLTCILVNTEYSVFFLSIYGIRSLLPGPKKSWVEWSYLRRAVIFPISEHTWWGVTDVGCWLDLWSVSFLAASRTSAPLTFSAYTFNVSKYHCCTESGYLHNEAVWLFKWWHLRSFDFSPWHTSGKEEFPFLLFPPFLPFSFLI
jgi:hypothetical protein